MLSKIASAAGLHQFGLDGQEFFLGAAVFQSRLASLRSLQLCLGAGSLGPDVVVIELQEELPLADLVALFDEEMLHRSGNGRVRFKIVKGLDFSVGRNQATDWAALHSGRANLQRSLVQV